MIRTTVVGSYPVPAWLRAYATRENVRDAMLTVLKTQELAGIEVVSDGELCRWDVNHPETNGMIDYFMRPMAGVRTGLSRAELEAWSGGTDAAYRALPAGLVEGPLSAGTLNLRRDYLSYRDLTPLPVKFTVTSPYMLGKLLIDRHYGGLEPLVMALADVLRDQLAGIDAEVIQIDEANLTGHPDDGPLAARAINHVLSGAEGGEKAVHLCYGNYGGQTIQQGTYRKLIEFMNRLECDHLVLEIARRPHEELAMLADVKPEIALGIGVIDIKDNEVETPDEVARRIERAAERLGGERIRYVHPDCGFWMLPRSVADAKMRSLVAGRNLYAGA